MMGTKMVVLIGNCTSRKQKKIGRQLEEIRRKIAESERDAKDA